MVACETLAVVASSKGRNAEVTTALSDRLLSTATTRTARPMEVHHFTPRHGEMGIVSTCETVG